MTGTLHGLILPGLFGFLNLISIYQFHSKNQTISRNIQLQQNYNKTPIAMLFKIGFMSFNSSKRFKKEDSEWRQILKDSGFEDLEDRRGNIKQPDIRTIAWIHRDEIRDFFLKLDQFMNCYPEMPIFERRVMELYSQGEYVKDIVRVVKSSDRNVRNVIKRYRNLVLALYRL